MSFEDAAAALEGAIEADNGVTPTPAPAPVPAEQAPVVPTTPEGETTPTQVQPSQLARDEYGRFTTPSETTPLPDTFDGGQFNPDTLPPELQAGWKQLQAAFTQKTQLLADERKQFEGIDAAEARQALELYTALQDPSYLVQFHGELTQALQAQGLTRAEAKAEAAQVISEVGGKPQGSVSDALAQLRNDPELAPVADELTQLRQEVSAIRAERETERARQWEAQQQMALAGEIIRQESVLRENGFNEAQIERVHELAAFHDGNLLHAAESYRAMRQETIEEFLAAKEAVSPGVGPLPGSGGTSEIPTHPQDLDEALKAALGSLAEQGITHIG
jgi:hypothetical protein